MGGTLPDLEAPIAAVGAAFEFNTNRPLGV